MTQLPQLPRIIVKNKLGSVVYDYTFNILEDEPHDSYDFALEEDASPVQTEDGKVISFPAGFRLTIIIQFTTEARRTGSNPLELWWHIMNQTLAGGKIYFVHYGQEYEVVVSPESHRYFEEGFKGLIGGELKLIGKERLPALPREF